MPFTSVTLGTTASFLLFETFSLAAMARALTDANSVRFGPVPGSDTDSAVASNSSERAEAVVWFMLSLVLLLLGALQWLGYGLHGAGYAWRVQARAPDARKRTRDEDESLWRAERFAAIVFWVAIINALVFLLAAFSLVRLVHALTVAGAFVGPLPVLWFASLGPYHTRPPRSLVVRTLRATADAKQ